MTRHCPSGIFPISKQIAIRQYMLSTAIINGRPAARNRKCWAFGYNNETLTKQGRFDHQPSTLRPLLCSFFLLTLACDWKPKRNSTRPINPFTPKSDQYQMQPPRLSYCQFLQPHLYMSLEKVGRMYFLSLELNIWL